MINLDPWQQEILDYKGDIGLNTGRRSGKTYVFARKSVEHMVKYGKPIICVSLTEEQAIIILIMALNYAKEAHPYKIGVGKYKPTMKTLTMMHKGKPVLMKSRPVGNSGDSTRGFEGGVLYVDEASRMPKPFWMAALPILLTVEGSEVWMSSTPHGKQGYYWKRYNEAMNLKLPNARFKFLHMNTPDVIANRKISSSWTKGQREGALKILEADKQDMSELEFGQEYMGLFLEELRQFFSDDLIKSRQTIDRFKQVVPKTGSNFMGSDIAGMGGDEIVQIGLNKSDRDKLVQIDQLIKTKQRLPVTVRQILERDLKFNYTKLGIDTGGIGNGVFDPLLEHDQTKRKVVALANASRFLDHLGEKSVKLAKEDMYNQLLWRMESGTIDLWESDRLFQSLRSVQAEYIKGKLRIFGDYTHLTEALIRATWLAKTKHLKLWVRWS